MNTDDDYPYRAYFWTEHDGIEYGLKLSSDVPWHEGNTPLYQEIDCLTHQPSCGVIRIPAVSQATWEREHRENPDDDW